LRNWGKLKPSVLPKLYVGGEWTGFEGVKIQKISKKLFFNLKRVLNINNSENREILPHPKKGIPLTTHCF